jgi:sec-independent protein translocase protein TatC
MPEEAMSLTEHFEEFRRRLLISVVAILVATTLAVIISDPLLKILLLPAGGLKLNAFELMDGFIIRFRVALYAGIVVAFPIWAYQLYRFISPGLLDEERKVIFPMLFGSLVLMLLGMVFGYYLLWGMIRVMREMFPTEVTFLPSADGYISFVIFFLLAAGTVFQLPTVILMLVQLRILNTRILRSQRKIAYFALFAFAEIITPVVDPIIAPLTVMGPMILLYELSIILARRIEIRREKLEAEALPD